MSELHRVPLEPFRAVVDPLMVAADLDMSGLARRCGLEIDSVITMMNREDLDFDAADLILCKLGSPHLWWGPLAEIYWAVKMPTLDFRFKNADRRQRCQRTGCSNTFVPEARAPKVGPKRRKFCSQRCASVASQQRRGQRPIGVLRKAGMCDSGQHDFTPENTIHRSDGTRRCRECRREQQRLWVAERRRQERAA